MMDYDILTATVAFLGGAAISLFNSLNTAKRLKDGRDLTGLFVALRQFISVAYLTATFLIVRRLDVNIAYPLAGAAVGLTVPSILFSITMAKSADPGRNGNNSEVNKQ